MGEIRNGMKSSKVSKANKKSPTYLKPIGNSSHLPRIVIGTVRPLLQERADLGRLVIGEVERFPPPLAPSRRFAAMSQNVCILEGSIRRLGHGRGGVSRGLWRRRLRDRRFRARRFVHLEQKRWGLMGCCVNTKWRNGNFSRGGNRCKGIYE